MQKQRKVGQGVSNTATVAECKGRQSVGTRVTYDEVGEVSQWEGA